MPSNQFYTQLGWDLKTLRLRKRTKAKHLAARMGISTQQLYKYESGKDRIPLERFIQYIDELGVSSIHFVIEK